MVFFESKRSKYFLLFCSIIIAIQAFGSVFKRTLYPLFNSEAHPKSIFQMSRLEQQVGTYRPDAYPAYAKFDSLVPLDATVVLATTNEDFEYPLFGEHFTRKLIPIHPFKSELKPIPKEADFVLITAGVMPILKTDIHLKTKEAGIENITPVETNQYYLRKLKK